MLDFYSSWQRTSLSWCKLKITNQYGPPKARLRLYNKLGVIALPASGLFGFTGLVGG